MLEKDYLINKFKKTPGVLKTGEFTLSSGEKSPYYIDTKKLLLTDDGLQSACHCISELEIDFEQVGGVELGAVPIVCGLLATSDMALDGFIIRKEVKNHGTEHLIEGTCGKAPTLIVEDVTTTGATLLKAIKTAEDAGAEVIAAVAVVDRSNGKAAELLKGIPFYSILKIEELF
jgi:orotate phosphoribosyltransferase